MATTAYHVRHWVTNGYGSREGADYHYTYDTLYYNGVPQAKRAVNAGGIKLLVRYTMNSKWGGPPNRSLSYHANTLLTQTDKLRKEYGYNIDLVITDEDFNPIGPLDSVEFKRFKRQKNAAKPATVKKKVEATRVGGIYDYDDAVGF